MAQNRVNHLSLGLTLAVVAGFAVTFTIAQAQFKPIKPGLGKPEDKKSEKPEKPEKPAAPVAAGKEPGSLQKLIENLQKIGPNPVDPEAPDIGLAEASRRADVKKLGDQFVADLVESFNDLHADLSGSGRPAVIGKFRLGPPIRPIEYRERLKKLFLSAKPEEYQWYRRRALHVVVAELDELLRNPPKPANVTHHYYRTLFAGADSLVQLFNMLSQAEERKICQPELYELLANLVLVNLDGAFEQKENLDPFSRFVDRDYVALVASVWNHAKQLALEYDRTGKSFAPITERALKELTEKAKAIAAKGDAYRMAELGMIILAIDPKNKIGRELVALAAQRGVTIP